MLKSTAAGFFRMERVGNEFLFAGESTAYEVPHATMAPLLGGIIGGMAGAALVGGISAALSDNVKTGAGLYRLNHRTGRVILVAQPKERRR